MLRALSNILFPLFFLGISGCWIGLGFYLYPEKYNYPILLVDYNLADLSTDEDIIVQTYDLEDGGSVNLSANCAGTVVYMELDHGKSLGKIYCKQGWYPDQTTDGDE